MIFLLVVGLYFAKFSYPLFIQKSIDNISGKIVDNTNLIYRNIAQSWLFFYAQILSLKDLHGENLKLKIENEHLRRIIYQSNLINIENQELRKMFSLEGYDRLGEVMIAQIIGASITPYNKRVLIKAGSADGVTVDDVITGSKGLLGRVIEVSENYSKGILLGDSEFRISVMSEEGDIYGILVKQDNALKIIYLEAGHNLQPGQFIYSSGDGTIFPSGILIGVVSKVTTEGEVYVKPIENLHGLGFVKISPSLRKITQE